MTLRIARGLALPTEAVTQTFAILAKRGVGKTYTAAVMVEEMVKAGLPVVVVDPIGVWWGLRSSADGKSEGLPVTILGGEHGDVPLEPGAGEVIADALVDDPFPAVLDLGLFRKGEQIKFMTAFAEAIYRRNRAPLHLVLDEADAFAPQRTMKGEGAERLLGAIEDLVRRGRARGIGVTLITQRPAVLNKNVLTQVEVLVALRMIAPQDRKAIDEWVNVHGERDQRDRLMESLPSLSIGEAWFWSPGWLELFKRVQVRERETYDSSRTPKAGERCAEPRAYADVDLEKLERRIAETIERAKQDDPNALRARIRELERELRQRPAPEPEQVEVPVLADGDVAELARAAAALGDAGPQIAAAVTEAVAPATSAAERIVAALERIQTNGHRPAAPPPLRAAPRPTPARAAPPPPGRAEATDGEHRLSSPQQRILDALAWFEVIGVPTPRRSPLGAVARSSPKSSGFERNLSTLRTNGLIDYPDRGRVALTGAGRRLAAPVTVTPTVEALHEAIYAMVSRPQAELLRVLVEAYPEALHRDELAERAGVSAASSGFERNVSTLRSFELIDYPARGYVVALEVLFP